MSATAPTPFASLTSAWRSFWSWTRSRITTITAWRTSSRTGTLTTACWVWPGSALRPVTSSAEMRSFRWSVSASDAAAAVCFSGSSGGICEKNKLYSDGKKKSLNTGIITVQNYASHVPPKVSHITFAHEVGHNFGSPVSEQSCFSYMRRSDSEQHTDGILFNHGLKKFLSCIIAFTTKNRLVSQYKDLNILNQEMQAEHIRSCFLRNIRNWSQFLLDLSVFRHLQKHWGRAAVCSEGAVQVISIF